MENIQFEQAPLALAFTLASWLDSSQPCPRCCPLQLTCGVSNCANCDHKKINLTGFDPQYTAGNLGKLTAINMPMVTGRRRGLTNSEHCKMSVNDLDMDRLSEQEYGKQNRF